MVLIMILTSHIRLLLGANGTIHVKLCELYMHSKCSIEISGCSSNMLEVIVVVMVTEIKTLTL